MGVDPRQLAQDMRAEAAKIRADAWPHSWGKEYPDFSAEGVVQILESYANRLDGQGTPISDTVEIVPGVGHRGDPEGKALDALRAVEWAGGRCPSCGGSEPTHRDGCPLGALLKGGA